MAAHGADSRHQAYPEDTRAFKRGNDDTGTEQTDQRLCNGFGGFDRLAAPRKVWLGLRDFIIWRTHRGIGTYSIGWQTVGVVEGQRKPATAYHDGVVS